MNKLNLALNLILLSLICIVFFHYKEENDKLYSKIETQREELSRLNAFRSSTEMELSGTQKAIDENRNEISDLKEKTVSVDRLKVKSITTEKFSMLSQNGKELISMKSYPNRTYLGLKTEEGIGSIYFNVHDDGKKSISFSDNSGHAQIGIRTDENDQPAITVWRGGEYILRGNEGHHEVIRISDKINKS